MPQNKLKKGKHESQGLQPFEFPLLRNSPQKWRRNIHPKIWPIRISNVTLHFRKYVSARYDMLTTVLVDFYLC